MKSLIRLLLLAGALPLIIYPGIALAGVMSLAAPASKDAPNLLLEVVVYSFLIGSLAYPVVYAPCALSAWSRTKKDDFRAAAYLSLAPLAYLFVIAGLLQAWISIESAARQDGP
jgi:hypothetical protein